MPDKLIILSDKIFFIEARNINESCSYKRSLYYNQWY